MSRSVLITGGSGYLGGSLLARLSQTNLPQFKLYALVRSDEQVEKVRKYGAEPLTLDLKDGESVTKAILNFNITVIFFLIDARFSTSQVLLIQALGEVKKQTGQEVHFLHTSGAKLFSSHARFPTDRDILDTDPELYDLERKSKARFEYTQSAVDTNTTVVDTAEAHGVRSYIFLPCIVYGEGEGFGNCISIQTTAIVQAAQKARAVYDVNPGDTVWPVCHIKDNSTAYITLLRSILSEEDLDYGKNGYYLAASGSVAWKDIYAAMAKALFQRKVIDDEHVKSPDEAALALMAEGMQCTKEQVVLQLGGICTLKAAHAAKYGWKAEIAPEHIFDAADSEVELILDTLAR